MSKRASQVLLSTVAVVWFAAMIVAAKYDAKSEQQKHQEIFQDGFKAGAAGVAIECPYSTWRTNARVEWNRGYVAGAVSRHAAEDETQANRFSGKQ
jgi:ribosome modulation factor